jgi:hypothetical protein
VRIERDLRLHDARGMRVVVAGREAQQLFDQLATEVEHDAVAGPRHAVVGHERADAAQHEHADDGERKVSRLVRIGILEVADDRDHEPGHHEVAGRDDEHADERDRERPQVGAHVPEKAAVEGEPGHHGVGRK